VQHEKVIHLDDFVLRRTKLAMLGRLTREMVEELAEILGNVLEWDRERINAEAARTLSILADRHGVDLKRDVG
jgi:glycerol-3-phosphate dehydrogenase